MDKTLIMKKAILGIAFVIFSLNASSQEIGIRFGEMLGNNVAVDGVFALNSGRIHADINFGDGVGIDVLYDFIFKPFDGANNLYYYIGVGGTTLLGSDYDNGNNDNDNDNDFYLGVIAEAGLEYRFPNAPIALGLDYRPSFIIVEDTDFNFGGFGFNARYIFN